MVCRYCGSEFEPKKRGRKNTGFCCKHCADNWRQHNVYDLQPPKYTKKCEGCGIEFQTNRKGQKYCTISCASKTAHRSCKHKRICKNCGKPFIATTPGMLYCSSTCSEGVEKDNHKKRVKQRREMTNEHHIQRIKVSEVYKEAHGVCSICGLPVPTGLDRNNMWSATRDHLIPLSKGGSHCLSNCQLAHRICNSCKGVEGDNFKIDWSKRLETEPEKWREKLDYLHKLIQNAELPHEAT